MIFAPNRVFMKFSITVLCIFYLNISFGQSPSKEGVNKSIILSDKLWSKERVVNQKEMSRILAVICINAGIDYLNTMVNRDSSGVHLNKGMLMAKEINQPIALQAAYKGFGLLTIQTNRTDSAVFYFQKSIAIAMRRKNLQKLEIYICNGLSIWIEKVSRQSVGYMKPYEQISDSLVRFNNCLLLSNQ